MALCRRSAVGVVFDGLALAASLLHEAVSPGMVGVTLAVILCVVGAKKFAQPVRVAAG